MWSRPIALSEEADALVLDTEGLSSVDRATDTDMKLFALTLLLASQFVFNTLGHISERAIEDLSAVTRLTRLLRINASDDSGAAFHSYFPRFVWVLRDFSLALDRPASQYLEDALGEREGLD